MASDKRCKPLKVMMNLCYGYDNARVKHTPVNCEHGILFICGGENIYGKIQVII